MRLALLAIALLGCGVPAGARTPTSAERLTVHVAQWNPSQAQVGPVKFVADLGTDVVIFSDQSATVLTDGVVGSVDHSASPWMSASTIPAPDGSGLWIVAVDENGQLWRLRARRNFEPISERYGLGAARVREVCGFGGRYVGFSIDGPTGRFAVADGTEVDQYASSPLSGLMAGSGTMAALSGHGVWTFDARTRASRDYELGNAKYVAVDDQGKLYAATSRAIYGANEDGTLVLRYAARDVHGLVASLGRVWFAEGSELGVIEANEVRRTQGAKLAEDARLTGSPSGDVWAVSHGQLTRYALGADTTTAARVRWEDAAQPVFSRVCASCHASDGSSGVDLTTADKWRAKRDLIRQRVLVDRDMPPANHPLTDPDRELLRRWLDTPAP